MSALDTKIDELRRNRERMTQLLGVHQTALSNVKGLVTEQDAETSARISRNIAELDEVLEKLRSIKGVG